MRPSRALAQAGLLTPSVDAEQSRALTNAIELAEHITDPVLRDRTIAELRKRLADMESAIRNRYGGSTTH